MHSFFKIKCYFLLPVGWRTETILRDQEKVMGKSTVGGHGWKGAGDSTNCNLNH